MRDLGMWLKERGIKFTNKFFCGNLDFESFAKDSACRNMGYLCLWIFIIFLEIAEAIIEPILVGLSGGDDASTFSWFRPVKCKNFDKNYQLT